MKKVWNADEKLAFERAAREKGYQYIAGVDEVGRGPLAGPVVCAAVIMPLEESELIQGVDDSKKLSAKKREELSEKIKEKALCYCIFEVDEKRIDQINILEAPKEGMKNALLGLKISPDLVLTDGNMTIDIQFEQMSIVKGDALSYSIGAASIIAKVHRDALMDEYAKTFPHIAFEKNKGYGTAEHIKGIKEHGLCPIHRRTFTKNF